MRLLQVDDQHTCVVLDTAAGALQGGRSAQLNLSKLIRPRPSAALPGAWTASSADDAMSVMSGYASCVSYLPLFMHADGLTCHSHRQRCRHAVAAVGSCLFLYGGLCGGA